MLGNTLLAAWRLCRAASVLVLVVWSSSSTYNHNQNIIRGLVNKASYNKVYVLLLLISLLVTLRSRPLPMLMRLVISLLKG